jgi:hypothetical protein
MQEKDAFNAKAFEHGLENMEFMEEDCPASPVSRSKQKLDIHTLSHVCLLPIKRD